MLASQLPQGPLGTAPSRPGQVATHKTHYCDRTETRFAVESVTAMSSRPLLLKSPITTAVGTVFVGYVV